MIHSFVARKGKPLESNLSRQDIAKAFWDKDATLWVDLEEPTEFESEMLVEIFNFHPLAVEDAINDLSQPKLDDYEEYLFLVVHGADAQVKEELSTIELDIFFNKNIVVTVHKKPMRSVGQCREYLAKKSSGLLGSGTEMLVHAILDRLVDNFGPVLSQHDQRIDEVEEEIFEESGPEYLNKILKLQKDILKLRRIIAPQRDTLYQLSRIQSPFVKSKNLIYFKDIYDHLFQIYQTAEGFHELLTRILQTHFSHVSAKLNEVMKQMTVLATMALPSVIIASIYGMNFKNMPELTWEHGYHFAIGLMALSSLIVIVWTKWKKWF